MTISYEVFETAFGWCAAARSEQGICGFVLPVPRADDAESAIRKALDDGVRSATGLQRMARKVRRYFEGRSVTFDVVLDLRRGTRFQQSVWRAVSRIPYARTRTYGEIARAIRRPKAVRAVGGAVGANPIPLIVPCHRVVAADGRLGGFSAAGGVALKQAMLQLEGSRKG